MDEVKVSIDATANLDPVVQEGANALASTNKGVCKIFRALFGPWIEERCRKADLMAEQTAIECQAVRERSASYANGVLIPYKAPGTLQGAYQTLHEINHAADAFRLKAVMDVAAEKLCYISDEEVSDDALSQTFFNRWRKEAELIDEDDLRERWANLLVEETKCPGSISPRTLDIVAGLSREEAAIFERACKGCWNGLVLKSDGSGHTLFCNYGECLRLADARLITLPAAETTEQHSKNDNIARVYKSAKAVLFAKTAQVKARGYALTCAGRELFGILNLDISRDEVQKIAQCLSKMNANVQFSLSDIIEERGENVVYSNTPFWSSDMQAESVQP